MAQSKNTTKACSSKMSANDNQPAKASSAKAISNKSTRVNAKNTTKAVKGK